MQNSIYYYTATGNSLYVAQTLAGELGDCRLVSIPACRQDGVVKPDTGSVGLVFPMHYLGAPPIVAEFVEKLDLTGVDYIFAVVTCGSTLLCNVLSELDQLLSAKEKRLDAGFYVRMVDNYLPMFPVPKETVQHKILAKSDKKIAYVVEKLNRKQQYRDTERLGFVCRLIHQYWLKRFDRIDSKFTNSSACTSCGLCAKVCPVDNIMLVEGRPTWQHHCQECLACIHACPAESIQFGRSKGKRRYHHPAIGWHHIIEAQKKK